MLEQGFSIQIGLSFYSSFSIPQISHSGGNGGKRCSFVVKLNGTEPPPRHKQLVSIVYTYRDGTVEKLFGGEVGSIQLMTEFFPYRVYQVTCKDFESIFLNVEPFSYRQLFPQPITVHAQQLMIAGGAIDPGTGDPWPRNRLDLIIRQASEPPPWVDSTTTNVDLQPFSVDNTNLGQAIQKLCAQFGFSYSVDFGVWLRIDLLGNNALANLILTRNDFAQTNERLLIDTSPDANPCLQTKYSNLKVQFQARDINRVVVAKDAESLLNRNVPQMDSTNNYLIAPNSPENSSPILSKTGIIKSYSIGTNPPNNTPTLCPIFNVQGNNTGDYNIYYLTTSDPNYSVLAGSGIKIDSPNQNLTYPVSKSGEATFLVDLTNVDYANAPSLMADISSAIALNSNVYNPDNFLFSNILNQDPGVLQVINSSNPDSQLVQLNFDNTILYNNATSDTTADLVFPLYAGFPTPSVFRMRVLHRTDIQFGAGTPPSGTYGRVEIKLTLGTTVLLDRFFQLNADGSSSGDSSAIDEFITFNANAFLGTTQTLNFHFLVHRPDSIYVVQPLLVFFGGADRRLDFDFPDPPDPVPTITATHKVLIQGVEIANLASTGEAVTNSQAIDLKPYAGQIVEIKTQSTLDIDQISNYVIQGEIRSDLTINCTDANGPNPGGGGGGS